MQEWSSILDFTPWYCYSCRLTKGWGGGRREVVLIGFTCNFVFTYRQAFMFNSPYTSKYNDGSTCVLYLFFILIICGYNNGNLFESYCGLEHNCAFSQTRKFLPNGHQTTVNQFMKKRSLFGQDQVSTFVVPPKLSDPKVDFSLLLDTVLNFSDFFWSCLTRRVTWLINNYTV